MPDERKEFEELTIKFGKGLAEDFTGKDGKVYKRILIPNANPADHSPWASFMKISTGKASGPRFRRKATRL